MSIERVNAGDRLAIRAADWNELARTADFVEGLRNRTGGAGSGRQELDPSKAYGYNSTGSALAIGNIVSVSDLAIDLVDGEWPVFDLDLPGDARLGIMLESVPATGDYAGLVCVAGVARTKVNVTDAEHQFAQPNGTLTALDSSESGPVRILWAEGEGDDQDALVRIEGSYFEGFPGILNLVTNVCPIGETKSLVFTAGADVVVDSEDLTVIASGTYTATAGTAKVKCVVIWTDPDFQASTGDSFGFELKVNTADYIGAPEYFVTAIGWGVTKTVEMTWDVAFPVAGDYALFLLGFRASGSAEITADAGSRIELEGKANGIRVEYTPVALPSVQRGTKVCIDNPTNCCVDDDSSGTASRDTASRSPFPLVYSQGTSPTCIDAMGYRGTDFGTFGLEPVSIARRYKLTLPTFEPYAFTDSYGNAIPACSQAIADHLSGRVVILETASGPGTIGPNEGQSYETDFNSFYNPEGIEGLTGGSCGYGVNWTGPTLEYTLPNGQPATWVTGSFAQIGVTWNYPATTPKLVAPRRVVFALRGVSYGLTMRAYSVEFRDDFFFDTPITLQVVNTPGFVAIPIQSGYPASGIRTSASTITLEPY